MERKQFSEIAGIMVRIRTTTARDCEHNDQLRDGMLIVERVDCGRIVAIINPDALFDAQGNRFEIDV